MSLSEERYKQLMDSVGMPNSRSLLQALQQCAMEVALIERERARDELAILAAIDKRMGDGWCKRMADEFEKQTATPDEG